MGNWTLREVKAQIKYDPDADEQVPKIVIGGKEYNWTEFGRELMTYEGWTLKFKIVDVDD